MEGLKGRRRAMAVSSMTPGLACGKSPVSSTIDRAAATT